ncbi:hypothetical protein Prudu_151S000100 [Prunus dulcis]|uniref:Uncharacterized protein n=1 Tax=Prunus dulcis TaxID=3755 RepID=A0A5H2XXV8_PRUDU|nr:hypothetical protein Prudu_151S000100 [Prunus dulcis]
MNLNPNKSKALQAGIPLFPTDSSMDLVSSLDCQKSDAQSVGLNEDRGGKDLFAPDIPASVICQSEAIRLSSIRKVAERISSCTGLRGRLSGICLDSVYFGKKKVAKLKKQRLVLMAPTFLSSSSLVLILIYKLQIGECEYCLKVGQHIPQRCPYKDRVPKNAILGSGCDVVCRVNTGLYHA